ncbi:MAG: hypothetical protein ACFFCS_05220 [Candidatus Hodarchaeota archaeon]
MNEDWITVKIPKEIHERVVKLIEHRQIKVKYAFNNVNDFLRRSLDRVVSDLEQDAAFGDKWFNMFDQNPDIREFVREISKK